MSLGQKLRHQPSTVLLPENEVAKIPTINLEHAGQLNLKEQYDNGVRVVLFDLHHTVAHFGTSWLKRDVIQGLSDQDPANSRMKFAIGSNGLSENQVRYAAEKFKRELNLDEIFAVAAGTKGYIRAKSDPQMGYLAAKHFRVLPSEIIVVGDQETDRELAINLGAGAFALCKQPGKIGEIKRRSYPIVERLGCAAVRNIKLAGHDHVDYKKSHPNPFWLASK